MDKKTIMQKVFIIVALLFSISSCSKKVNYNAEIKGTWNQIGIIENDQKKFHTSGIYFHFAKSGKFIYYPNYAMSQHGNYSFENKLLLLIYKYPSSTEELASKQSQEFTSTKEEVYTKEEKYTILIENDTLYLTRMDFGTKSTSIWKSTEPITHTDRAD